MNQEQALLLLQTMFGTTAIFRNGQLEAILAAANGKKMLVVQQTGWGKSVVYFIATKLRREQGRGITLLISPLLALMRNQIENASRIGLQAATINSDNQDEWEEVIRQLMANQCDILLLSPERLANEDFRRRVLPSLNIGMFVVDEAHCISDWGHDFRPDYQRIVNIINALPPNIPVLATTATANDRVIEDIQQQLGDNLGISRGTLIRDSLRLQVIKLADQAERLAWLYENLESLPGTGIIYCLTTHDCDKVARWLKKKGYNVEPYHSKLGTNNLECAQLRAIREDQLMKNQVKALVATVALGMGYDKPDVGFVIHYQRPGNLIAYYQQIGRAGRNISNAFAILLNGKEDDDIQEYFIKSAFPPEVDMIKVLQAIDNAEFGLSKNEILARVNANSAKIDKILKFLLLQNAVIKSGTKYVRTPHEWKPNVEKSTKILATRYSELQKIKEFVDTKQCYLRYVAEELDDPFARDCEKCVNCTGKNFFPDSVSHENILDAVRFIKGDFLIIEPRKQWPTNWVGSEKGRIKPEFQCMVGRALCSYGDAGWGAYVKADKYIHNHFREELVDATVELLENWGMNPRPTWVTSIPSLRHPNLVSNFAERVAKKVSVR